MARDIRIYHDGDITPGTIIISGEEHHHATNVLRAKAGFDAVVFNGMGITAQATISSVDRQGLTLEVGEVQVHERYGAKLILAVAIPKGKRWQTLIEKCTELGVGAIWPVIFERSVVEGSNIDKWKRWAVEACKQCRSSWLPEIILPLNLSDILSYEALGPCLLADPDGDRIIKWGGQIDRAKDVLIVVGPEGGLTDEEIAACRMESFAPVKFSDNILRIETAAISACALVKGLAF